MHDKDREIINDMFDALDAAFDRAGRGSVAQSIAIALLWRLTSLRRAAEEASHAVDMKARLNLPRRRAQLLAMQRRLGDDASLVERELRAEITAAWREMTNGESDLPADVVTRFLAATFLLNELHKPYSHNPWREPPAPPTLYVVKPQ